MASEEIPSRDERVVLLFFHEGFSPYLPFVIWQARKSNPSARILLLGDRRNQMEGMDYEHHLDPGPSTRRKEFLSMYQHFHPGNLEDERRCIERWIRLADFLKTQDLREFLFLDSDMLFFEDVKLLLPQWRGYDAAGAPLFYSFCHFFRAGLVEEFAEWILDQYRNPKVMKQWASEFDAYISSGGKQGSIIQDMALADRFVQTKGVRMLDVTQPANGKMVDSGKWGGSYMQGRASTDRLCQRAVGETVRIWNSSGWLQLSAVHVQGNDKSHIPGLTGWAFPIVRSFWRPNFRRNLKFLIKYAWNGILFRRYLKKNEEADSK